MAVALSRLRPLKSSHCHQLHKAWAHRVPCVTAVRALQSSARLDLYPGTSHECIAQWRLTRRSLPLTSRILCRYFSDQKDQSHKKEDDERSPTGPPTLKTSLLIRENIYTLPNALTVSRLLSAPLIGYCLLTHQPTLALGLFVYAGATDLIDGWLARRWKQESVLGSVLDPAGDKALMTICTLSLGWLGALPVPLALTIISRDILLSFWAFYIRYSTLPPPRTFARYWDFSIPSAEVKPTQLSKINTFLQLGLIGATMGILGTVEGGVEGLGEWNGEGLGGLAKLGLEASWLVVGATTVMSGVGYFRGGRGWKVVR